jgi:hypothetical protein
MRVKIEYLAIISIIVFIELMISPFINSAVNDDWAYSQNVLFLLNGRDEISFWPAATVLSQTFIGYLFSLIFGFSFAKLKILTVFVGSLGLIGLFEIVFKITKSSTSAFAVVLMILAQPFYIQLSNSFMTEIYEFTFLIFAILSYLCFLEREKKHFLFLMLLFFVLAILVRQTSFILFFAIFTQVLLIQKQKKTFFLWSIIILVFILFITSIYIRNINPATKLASIFSIFNNFKSAFPYQYYLRFGLILTYIGIYSFPLIFLFSSSLFGIFKSKKLPLILLIYSMVFITVFYSFNHIPLPNCYNFIELGPRVLHDYKNIPPSEVLKIILLLISLISFFLITVFLSSRKNHFLEFKSKFGFVKIYLVFFISFLIINPPIFDRYLFILLAFTSILFAIKIEFNSLLKKISFFGIISSSLIITIIQNYDYFSWIKAKTELISKLQSKNIDSGLIDGGFEFNGWNNDNLNRSSKGKSWYFVKDDYYLISNSNRISNYSVIDSSEYSSFMKKRFIYTLERKRNP